MSDRGAGFCVSLIIWCLGTYVLIEPLNFLAIEYSIFNIE